MCSSDLSNDVADPRHSGICERREPSDAVENVRLASTIFRNDLSSREKEKGEILAYSSSERLERQWEITSGIVQKFNNFSDSCWWDFEPNVGRVADGIPNRIQRLKGLGNAQVPIQAAVAFQLLKTSFCELQ